MVRALLVSVAALLCAATAVQAFASGSPSCSDPGPPMATQQTVLGFKLELLDVATNAPTLLVPTGGQIKFRIHRGGQPFKGFVLNARIKDVISGEILAPLPPAAQYMSRFMSDCNGNTNAVTHTEAMSVGVTEPLDFIWQAPHVMEDTEVRVHMVGVVSVSQWQRAVGYLRIVGPDLCQNVTCPADTTCATSHCERGVCVQETAPDGTACDDGNDNTINDKCTYGFCYGVERCSILDCGDDNSCTNDLCVGDSCVHTNVVDGTACNDNNPFTAPDTCQGGVCIGVDVSDL